MTFLGALARVQVARAGLAGGPPLSVDLFNDHQLVLPTAGAPVKRVFLLCGICGMLASGEQP